VLRIALIVAFAAALALVGPAQAQDFSTLEAACNANPQTIGVDGLEQPGAVPRFCSCLVTQFPGLDQDDVNLLVREVEGTSSAELRDANPNSPNIERMAEAAVAYCVSPAILSGAAPDASGSPFHMEPLAEACVESGLVLGTVSKSATGPKATRIEICGCMVTDLKGRITAEEAPLITRAFQGTLTAAEREASEELGERFEAAFSRCLAVAGIGMSD
jgi:hypothetical protein